MDDRSLYGGIPPYVAGSDTSQAAAITKLPTAASQRWTVYRYLRDHGPRTQEELSTEMHLDGNSVRPRLCELVKQDLVVDSGLRRRTRSGRYAVVWMGLEEAGDISPRLL